MTAAQLLARAFQSDPFVSWAEPDAGRRPRTSEHVFRGMIRFSERVGGHLHEPGVGSVHWRAGEAAHLDAWDVLTSRTWSVALVAPPPVWLRLSAHEHAAMERVRRYLGPGAGYLCQLGVDPSRAGQGHGSRLLKRALQQMASRFQTCVLRTEQPRNLPFYLRNGFTQVDELVVPRSGLRTTIFSRTI